MTPGAVILARGNFLSKHGKTAHGLIRYGKRYKILSVIDETCSGSDAGELLGMGEAGIPVVKDVPSDAEVLIIGVAPSGGRLPLKWRADIKTAIEHGMDIVSGLHEFISDDPELADLADKHGVGIIDVRKPPAELVMASGYRSSIPVVLTAGTDACVGKRTAALELVKSAANSGYDAGFIATGQTGIMIGCDAGITVDSLPADFVSGMVEKAVHDVNEMGKDIIFIEGQGAISHFAYGAVSHGLLYGARPHGIVMVHSPLRTHRSSFKDVPVPSLESELNLINSHFKTQLVGIALNCSEDLKLMDCSKYIKDYETEFSVPVEDVIKSGADRIFDNIEALIKTSGT